MNCLGFVAIAAGLTLAACHPTAADSPGANPAPPADAPSSTAPASSAAG